MTLVTLRHIDAALVRDRDHHLRQFVKANFWLPAEIFDRGGI